MALHVQNFLVYCIVGGATWYLVRHLWLTTRSERGCGACASGCGKSKPPEEKLVQLELGSSWKK